MGVGFQILDGHQTRLETLFRQFEQRLLGSKMGSTRLTIDIPRYISLYQQKRLKLDELISGRFPLEKINEAIADVSQGDALRNVIIFDT